MSKKILGMEEEIADAIQKHLPSKIGEALANHLKEAEATKQALVQVTSERDTMKRLYTEKNNEIGSLERIIRNYGDYEAKFASVETRERNLAVFELTVQLREAEKRSQSLHDLISQLFKSPIVRRSFSQTDMTTDYYNNEGLQKIKTGHNVTELIDAE